MGIRLHLQCNDVNLPNFFCSYDYWNKLRCMFVLASIEYIRCYTFDSRFEPLGLEFFLFDFMKHSSDLSVLSYYLKEQLFLLNKIDLAGIYYLIRTPDDEGIIDHRTSLDISKMMEKVMPFIQKKEKDIERIRELFIYSYSNQQNICID